MLRAPRFLVCFAVLWSLVSLSASAQSTERTEALLRIVGIDTFLSSFAADLTAPDNALADSFGDGSDAWTSAASEHFDGEEMFVEMTSRFEGTFEEDELAQLFAFYESRLGLRITGLEVQAQAPEESERAETEGTAILAKLIEDEDPRLEAYGDLIEALSAIDTGLALAMNLNFAVLTGMAGSGEGTFSLGEGDILALIESQRGVMEAAIREQLYVTLAYTYEPLSDDELKTYTDFLSTDVGREFYRRLNTSVEAIMHTRARAFGGRLMQLRSGQTL